MPKHNPIAAALTPPKPPAYGSEFAELIAAMSVRKGRFTVAYLTNGGIASKAALEAGYSLKNPQSAKARGYVLLQDPQVQAAIQAAQRQVATLAEYNMEVAMQEFAEGIEFARQTGNANAMVRAQEMRARLTGLLVDKSKVQIEVVDLGDALREARARVAAVEARTIEGEVITDAELALPEQPQSDEVDIWG